MSSNISRRDYFASHAIGAWTTMIATKGLSKELIISLGFDPDKTSNAEATAKLCYMIADAMITEGDKI